MAGTCDLLAFFRAPAAPTSLERRDTTFVSSVLGPTQEVNTWWDPGGEMNFRNDHSIQLSEMLHVEWMLM